MSRFIFSFVLFLVLCSVVVFTPNVWAAEEGSWEVMEPMPTEEPGAEAAVVNGKIYVIGGLEGEVTYVYDPATNNWTTKTPLPRGIGMPLAVYRGKIYAIGGKLNQVYDPVADTWENRTGMPTPRSGLSANVVDGKIYLIAGKTGGAYSTVDVHEVYDPETDTWTTAAPIPYPVAGYASVVVDGKIYVMGGQDEFHDPMNLNFTQIYDPETDTWSQGVQMPTATVDAPAEVTTGIKAPQRIHVLGGSVGLFEGTDRHLIYDPESDEWTRGPPIPTPRADPGGAVVDDLIYVIGGLSSPGGFPWEYTAANERYTPAGWIPEYPTWAPILLLMVVLTVTVAIYTTKIKN